MPRRLEHTKRCQNFADITINSYANSKIKGTKGRIKKSAFVRPDKVADNNTDDFVGEFDDIDRIKQQLKDNLNVQEQQNHVYNEYPIDFWWLLSDYVEPQDVGRFALISKSTYTITGSIKFWKSMYNRYYDSKIRLPIRLQPDCMARPGGLRACVIRSLFYTYKPFIQYLIRQPQQDFHLMVNRYVDRFWYIRKGINKWLYFYKIKRKPMAGSRAALSESMQKRNSKSLTSLSDIHKNPEEGCSLLIIQTNIFHQLPKLTEEMEMEPKFLLSSIGHHLSRSCNHYRLELKFSNLSKQTIATVSYEPAISITVHDWWTPIYYKHVKQGFQDNLEFLKDEKDILEEIDADEDIWNFNVI